MASGLLGMLVGIGVFTLLYAEGQSYLSNDPEACASCHIMREQLDSWQKSSHHARAACNDCHVPHALAPKLWTKAENGWNHSLRFTLQDFDEPIRIRAANARRLRDNCIACHLDLVDDTLHGGPTGEPADCTHCHARVGHGPQR